MYIKQYTGIDVTSVQTSNVIHYLFQHYQAIYYY